MWTSWSTSKLTAIVAMQYVVYVLSPLCVHLRICAQMLPIGGTLHLKGQLPRVY